jgi:16S rRNA (guanine966-N2)-methyltransferase
LGIEALSRGASSCAFLERDRKALDSIRHNIKTLQLTDNTTVLAGDVMTIVVALRNVDLVLADPPYDFDRWADLLAVLNLVMAPGGVVVTESAREIQPPEGWQAIRSKRYGRAWMAFLQRTDD